MKPLFTLFLFAIIFGNYRVQAQNPSTLYQNWVDAQENETEPILPTFSYAGYHHGEAGTPNSFTQTVFDVTDYGAVADDENSDKSAIMDAIAAAEANSNGGVVYFPSGRFIVNDADVDDPAEVIEITKSNIVIKGSGSGPEGTELYQKNNTTSPTQATKDYTCPYLFLFKPDYSDYKYDGVIANVTGNVTRETFSVEVDDISKLQEGQWIELGLKDKSTDLLEEELAPYSKNDLYNPNNLKIVKNGVEVKEFHKIKNITGNTITFYEPIHKTIDPQYNWQISEFTAIEEVGMQDLRYTGGFIWKHLHHQAPKELYPKEGKSGPHAYLSSSGWSGIQLNRVVNGWIKNVRFTAMSQAAQIKLSAYSSALDNEYVGNPGHNFISANSATGSFIGRNTDKTSGVWHGCGVNSLSIGSVLWRNSDPQNGKSGMEIHASQPRASLFDVCIGGFFFNQGGALQSLPNHLRNMVLWNFEGVSYQSSNVKSWRPNSETPYAKFLMPIIVGLKGFTMSSEPNQYQVNESPGQHVDPESLYEAQLAYRLGELPFWITNSSVASKVTLDHPFLDLKVDDEDELSAIVLPSYATDKSVTWSSSNPAVATVDANGKVKAIKPGTSEITVTTYDGRHKMSSTINVNNVAIGKKVTASSEPQPENPGSAAVDGNNETRWSAENFPQSLVVDLGKPTKIFKTSLVTKDGRAYQFKIEAKDHAGDSYSLLIDRSGNNENGTETNPIQDEFIPMTTRYLRISFSGANQYTGPWTSIQEFSVFVPAGSLGTKNFDQKKTSIAPNPFSSEFEIKGLNGSYDQLKLYDMLGRKVYSKNLRSENTVRITPSLSGSGMYLLKLTGKNKTETHKLVRK